MIGQWNPHPALRPVAAPARSSTSGRQCFFASLAGTSLLKKKKQRTCWRQHVCISHLPFFGNFEISLWLFLNLAYLSYKLATLTGSAQREMPHAKQRGPSRRKAVQTRDASAKVSGNAWSSATWLIWGEKNQNAWNLNALMHEEYMLF